MLFNSLDFVLFLPSVIILYYLLPYKFRWILLLVASYFFYMVWNPKYIILIIISTVVDYSAGILMEKYSNHKKKFLILSLVTNLSFLFFFKYFNFFNDSLQSIFNIFNLELPYFYNKLLLPMGISFYTFQTLSYTIDVYKGKQKAERHLGYFALYVTFFPQLVAGPIERSNRLLPSLKENKKLEFSNIATGLLTIGIGFFKKMIIADRLAIVVDTVFNDLTSYNGAYLLVIALFFSLQIYCDFSGYSSIAIGSAKLMGHDLMENFRYPFFSSSIKEFWSRWHISLSTWFRDYLYIPLGGNRKGIYITYRNILIVFVVSGFWHGAAWTFILWGLLNGLYQIIEDIFSRLAKKHKIINDINVFIPEVFRKILTFLLTIFTFVVFRANNIGQVGYFFRNIFYNNFYILFDGSLYNLGLEVADFNLLLIAIVFLSIIEFMKYSTDVDFIKGDFEKGLIGIILLLLVLVFGFYGEFDTSSFIYFQF